ncbi:5-(carboxyamino)imidazole ribonucleotide mutase [Brevibacterium sp.]|uniref:5-(carboxyamino)imidazole ribonucleotide mutase n=1 Tax=Brevibacterium sp. TaxID=1701 RepID=UPI002649FEBF|nr:5-(carboxyamino)imidazole ribonucleotide mutase [Brevibacterium sp.]MDN6605880.1 5-(carboxyamino)imidazole ribonucleotide mutase [Brevibacterium sp.]
MPPTSDDSSTTNGSSGPTSATGSATSGAAVVGIVMGSDSDWPTMKAAAEALEDLGIDSTAEVVSAHRMPEDMVEWAKTAADRGLRGIIAGAGGAAHLPGMIAAMTSLPVIGVPVPLKYLDGMDSLLSIVQMPGGVPVATVSIGGAKNAGLLAARILGAGETDAAAAIRSRLDEHRSQLRQVALDKGRALRR